MRASAAAVLCLVCSVGAAEEIRLPAVADVWVSAYHSEVNYNVGAGTQLKLKGIQEMSIVRFDVSPLRGRRVLGGYLFFKESGRKNALRKIGLSTVSATWIEGRCTRYGRDDAGHGATFMEASYKRRAWSYKGSNLTDVTMGNGNTLQHHTELVRTGGGWFRLDVPAYLIQALVAGASDGLLVMDESGETAANNYVSSREQPGAAPYLLVRVGPREREAPAAPGLKLRPEPRRATVGAGAAALLVRPPRAAFAYDIKVNGRPLERWRIPFAPGVGEPVTIGSWRVPPTAKMEGAWQKIVLEDLPPGEALNIELRAVSRAGIRGEWARVTGEPSPALARPPRLRRVAFNRPAGEPPVHAGRMRVWAFPEVVKVDPRGGRQLAALRRSNYVWSGADRTITLSAARGEIVAFQLCVEAVQGKLADVRLVPSSLVERTGRRAKQWIDGRRVDLYSVWYVKAGGTWQGEYAIPLRQGQGVEVPWAKNRIEGQKNQAFYVDILVPKDLPAGDYAGDISVSARGVRPVSLPVRLKVHNFALPDEMNFYGDLNCYGGPGRAGSKRFRASHRLAHAHRCTIVRVPYGHNGRTHDDLTPPVSGRGTKQRISDWRRFDRDVGPLLDGSLFKGCPRDGVPVNVFHLPFHENWPNRLKDHYTYRGPQRGKGIMRPFALNARPPQQAFSREFREGFRAVVRDFAMHARTRGWTRTRFLCCFNNKWYYRANRSGRGSHGTSWWLFDEPVNFDDWEAIAFMGSLFRQGVRGVAGVNFILRADISRPRWQRNWMNGLLDRICISRDLYTWPRRCEIIRREVPCVQIRYGSCNGVDEPNVITHRWCVQTYLLGADGVLPWQTLAGDRAFDAPNRNGIVVDGTARFGVPAIASLRLKALRRGIQDVEYLVALARRRGWTRGQVRLCLTGTPDYRGAVDRIGRWTVRDLASVREAVARLIAP